MQSGTRLALPEALYVPSRPTVGGKADIANTHVISIRASARSDCRIALLAYHTVVALAAALAGCALDWGSILCDGWRQVT